MRTRLALLLTIAVVCATAEAEPTVAQLAESQPELSLQYTYVRSNVPVGQCGCFSPQGGSASFAMPLHRDHLSVAADVTAAHAGKISRSGYDLTFTAFTAGVRYRPSFPVAAFAPFAQVLAGGAHAGGSLVAGGSPAAKGSSVVFASNIGGGLDWKLGSRSRLSWRVVEADYLVTLFHNGQNDHQNVLRLGSGLVIYLGRR